VQKEQIPSYPWNYKIEPIRSQYITDIENVHNVDLMIQQLICPQYTRASYYIGRSLNNITDCTTFSVCNSTVCLYYGPSAVAFGLMFSDTRGHLANVSQPCVEYKSPLTDNIDNCKPITVRQGKFQDINPSVWNRNVQNVVSLDTIFRRHLPTLEHRVQKVLSLSTHLIQRFFHPRCQVNESMVLTMEQIGPLPIGCFKTFLYNTSSEIAFDFIPQFFLESWPIRTDFCKPSPYEEINPYDFLLNETYIPFNLPRYRYDRSVFA
jgi:hypothetical protein